MLIEKLNLNIDIFDIFKILNKGKHSFFLESGKGFGELGRFSFAGNNPVYTFQGKNKTVKIDKNGKYSTLTGNVFDLLDTFLKDYHIGYHSDIPFVGGAVGYLGYDLCHSIEMLPRKAADDIGIPDCFFGIYDGIIIYDNKTKNLYAAGIGINQPAEEIVRRLKNEITRGMNKYHNNIIEPQSSFHNFKSDFSKEEYLRAINRIKEYICNGDIYQANLSQRFEFDIINVPFRIYERLRKINPVPFGGYFDCGYAEIVCSSPERLLNIKGDILETRPIKGTIAKGISPEENEFNRTRLLNSVKDKAELLMIVDLERNDLGKVSKKGSVKVEQLFHIEEYSNLYHLVSTIKSEMKTGINTIDCIKAIFPGGSITGAPKIRAMEIIDEIEPFQRNIYTGALGYIGFNGDADLNIMIRTILCKGKKAYFNVGGGIVWDSDPEKEYYETILKGKKLFEAIK